MKKVLDYLAQDNVQKVINILLALTIPTGLIIGFLLEIAIIPSLLTSLISTVVFVIYNIWVSDYINIDRSLQDGHDEWCNS